MRLLCAVTSILLVHLLASGNLAAQEHPPSGGSTPEGGASQVAATEAQPSRTARAAMKNGSGATIGDAQLRQTPNGILLKVDLRGIEPGIHAVHIHETGRCEPPGFQSAGGHFAARGREHGFLDRSGPHAGDLPNAHVLADRNVSFEYFVPDLTLEGGTAGLLDGDGAALVVHADADDYHTDPAGAAGDRIACGVIMR